MKNFIAICISCFVFFTSTKAQMDFSVQTPSSKFAANLFSKPTEIVLPPFSRGELDQLDYNDTKNGHMPAIARNIATNITLNNTGTWTTLTGGDRVWRVRITGAGALALAPLFDELFIPEGATMHIYMVTREETLGAFTHDNTPEPRSFCGGLVHGESCIVEYYEPAYQKNKGILSINKVGYAYRDISPLRHNDLKSGSGPCQVNIACPEGNNWRNQERSVARIFVVADNGNDGWCSGALVNNVRKDCTPYMLSAEHCTESGVSAASYAQWVFYFNYQGATCSDTTGPENNVVNGCKKMADSEDNGGNSGSDFLLVQLNHAPPTNYNVYYSGWDITNTAATNGVGIHHPSADIKKISTYQSTLQSTAWGNVAQNTHWKLIWTPTTSGHGVTEPGSSGSPLFNGANGLIVGHLTGGGSCCAANGCVNGTSPNAPDYYGKLAYDWTSDGVSPATQLKAWLDPDNTGTTTLQGMTPPCGSAIANDAGIQAINEPKSTVCTSSATPVIVLRNFGNNTLTSIRLSYKYDNGSLSTYNWTGNLLPGSTTNVTLPTTSLSPGTHSFTVSTSLPNGQTDANSSNNSLTSNFFISSTGGNIDLSLTTDNVGSKTTWQITDVANNVVVSGGPYVDLAGGTTYDIPVCVPSGCYTFTIFSALNNGMTSGQDGYFLLTGGGGAITYAGLTNPSFGSQEAHNFCVTATAIEEIPAFRLSVTPNPSTGQFTVSAETADQKTYRVFDITGKLIVERNTANQNFVVDLTRQNKGVYILQIETQSGTAVQKLVIK